MYRLRAGITVGTIDTEYGSFAIVDGEIECSDYATASALIGRHGIDWIDGDPGPPDGESAPEPESEPESEREPESEPEPGSEPDTASEAEAGDEVDSSDGAGDNTPDDGYGRDELEGLSYDELRSMAAEGDHPDVDGRSSKEAIIDAYSTDADADADAGGDTNADGDETGE